MDTKNNYLRRYLRLTLAGLLLIIASLACDLSAVESLPSGLDEVEIKTSVARTLIAKGVGDGEIGIETAIVLTLDAREGPDSQSSGPNEGGMETAVAQTVAAQSANAQQPTPQPQQPSGNSDTPISTPSQTPSIPPSPTSDKPVVQVSVGTNCRKGPGDAYDITGALLKGEVAEIIAKDPWDLFWYIPNPDRNGAFCWVWGQYASTTGNTDGLPVYTPEPTPTLSSPTPSPTITTQPSSLAFSVSFRELNPKCCIIEFTITNTGSVTIESYSIDASFGANSWWTSRDKFEDLDAAWNKISVKANLPPGSSGYGWVGPFSNDPAGQNVSAWVQVCSADGGGGTCVSKTINFTP